MSETQNNLQNGLPKPPVAPFFQQPIWDTDATIILDGRSFETMYNFISMFGPAVDAARKVLRDNLETGVVKLQNLNEQGEKVSDEVVAKFNAEMLAYRAKLQESVKAMGGTPGPTPDSTPKMEVHRTPQVSEDIQEAPDAVPQREGIPESEALPPESSEVPGPAPVSLDAADSVELPS